jgi:hypothetical protein
MMGQMALARLFRPMAQRESNSVIVLQPFRASSGPRKDPAVPVLLALCVVVVAALGVFWVLSLPPRLAG